jgi:hypothetical protein
MSKSMTPEILSAWMKQETWQNNGVGINCAGEQACPLAFP